MKNLLIIIMLLFISQLTFAKIGRTGKEVNPFENHDKNIAKYEDYLRDAKRKKDRKKVESYKKKLALWKKFKLELLAEKVTPLDKEVTRNKGLVKQLQDKKKKTLEELNKKLEKYNGYIPKVAGNPEKAEKLQKAIESTKKKLPLAEKHYSNSIAAIQKNIDGDQELINKYYEWSSGLTAKDVKNYHKNKNKLGSFKLN